MANAAESAGEDVEVAYSALKSIVGGASLCFAWAVLATGGESNSVFASIIAIFGGPLIAVELRKTPIARFIFVATLCILAAITFLDLGMAGINIVLFLLGVAGVTLVYEVGRRRLSFIGS